MWNGVTWAALGSGVSTPNGGGIVHAVRVFDDGYGPALYAGGTFTTAGSVPAVSIARWNGASWASVGGGLSAGPGVTPACYALEVFDDGSGPALYAGGSFTFAGAAAASSIAKWNGSSWAPLGSGVDATVYAMRAYDGGDGPRLHVGGYFAVAGGVPAANIARWDGATWSAIGTGIGPLPQQAAVVRAIETWDTGHGSSLFVKGRFNTAGGNVSQNVAELVSLRPRMAITQLAGPGSGVIITNSSLTVGVEYYNVFSLEPAPAGPGTGPYLGLYATDVTSLFTQFYLPLGTVPFHFTATTSSPAFGPYQGPPGLAVEGVCFEFTNFQVTCSSTNPQLVIQ
jgi:hypothetical protein